jgi:hypothetical protein
LHVVRFWAYQFIGMTRFPHTNTCGVIPNYWLTRAEGTLRFYTHYFLTLAIKLNTLIFSDKLFLNNILWQKFLYSLHFRWTRWLDCIPIHKLWDSSFSFRFMGTKRTYTYTAGLKPYAFNSIARTYCTTSITCGVRYRI